MEIYSLIPNVSPIKLDIMFGDKFGGQIVFPCTVGQEYSYKELRAFAMLRKPSLKGKDFEILPCGKPKFRN